MWKRISLALIVSLLLTGCGFMLRGTLVRPPDSFNDVTIVSSSPKGDLARSLKTLLEAWNIHVSKNAKKARYLLILKGDALKRQITNISASTTPRQYQLIYTVKFSLLKTGGPIIIPVGNIMVTRQFTLNNNRILGSNYEQQIIYNEMRRDAAMQIMNKITRTLQNSHVN